MEQHLKTIHNMFPFPISNMSHNPRSLKTSLISCWEFNETTGSLLDQHNSNNLIVGVAPTYSQSGHIGDSILFNGTTQYFREATSSNTFTPNSNVSYSCWVYKSTGSDSLVSSLMTKYYSNTGNRVMVFTMVGNAHATVANRIQFGTYDTSNVANNVLYNAAGPDLWSGNWTHFVGVHNGTTNYLYVNGEMVLSNTAGDGSIRQSTVSYAWFAVGAMAKSTNIPDALMNGKIDQSAVWGKALTEAEIKFLYNQGSGVPYAIW